MMERHKNIGLFVKNDNMENLQDLLLSQSHERKNNHTNALIGEL